ncbi:MAG: aminoglycoside phosphotransferase family protein [Propionibacteriaceae bacterium]|nr:phosphotransferase [Micropruina sp.]HBX81785.1 aminoglycoside resistance protein [Propionibacteriaceae bacterium]HBY24114.1 aminoglycoside resistance protein [Propionibacteriaceae bacterium]
MFVVPSGLEAQRERSVEWAAWLDGLPRLVSGLLEDWELAVTGAPRHGKTALVLPVSHTDGSRLMLKVARPEPDNAGEVEALKAWRGLGAVRLERADPHRGALLLERLTARDLNSVDALEACQVVARLYPRLHLPPTPRLPLLADQLSTWLDDLAALGRDVPAPPRFVQQALAAGRALVEDPPTAIVHGDLHYGNVLAGRREPWLAIDPKGFSGDPASELGPLLWNRWEDLVATGDVGGALRERFYVLVDATGLDERRCRDWVVVRAMVGVGWEASEARACGRSLGPEQRAWITRLVTTAKAMQEVGAPPSW